MASAAVVRLVTREINVSVTKAETTGTEDTGDDWFLTFITDLMHVYAILKYALQLIIDNRLNKILRKERYNDNGFMYV